MAISVTQSSGTNQAEVIKVSSIASPSFASTSGRLLVAMASVYGTANEGATPFADGGTNTWYNSKSAAVGSGPDFGDLAYAKNITGKAGEAVTFSLDTAQYPIVALIEASGCDTTDPCDVAPVYTTITSGPTVTKTITPPAGEHLIVGVGWCDTSGTVNQSVADAGTGAATWSSVKDDTNDGMNEIGFWTVVTCDGSSTYGVTFTHGASGGFTGGGVGLVAFKAEGALTIAPTAIASGASFYTPGFSGLELVTEALPSRVTLANPTFAVPADTPAKMANANTVVVTGWTNPTYAYADDGSYATAAIGSKSTSITSDFGFPAFTTGDIPDGSTINSVTAELQYKSNTTSSTGAVIGCQLNNNGTLLDTETTWGMNLSDQTVTKAATSGVALADLRTAGQFKARVRGWRGTSNTAVTWSVDYVKLTVNYTPPVTQYATPVALSSGSTIQAPVVERAEITVSPTALASAASVSAPALAPGAVSVSPSSLAPAVTIQTPTLDSGAATVSPTALASGVQLRTPTFQGQLPTGYYPTTFGQTENPISEIGLWNNGQDDGVLWQNVKTASGAAYGLQSGSSAAVYDDSIATLKGTWASNQEARATVVSTDAQGAWYSEVELLLRFTIGASSITGYEANFSCNADGGHTYASIVRHNGGGQGMDHLTVLQTTYPGIVTTGDVIRFTAVGSTLTAYINDVQVVQATDATYTNGQPGIGFFLQNYGGSGDSNAFGLSDFTAQDVLSVSPTALASGSAIQTPTLQPSAVTVAVSALGSGVSFLTPELAPGAVSINPTALASGVSLSAPTLSPGPVSVSPTALASGVNLAIPELSPGPVSVGPANLVLTPTLMAPTLLPGPIWIAAVAIGSGYSVAVPTFAVSVSPAILAITPALYTPTLVGAGTGQDVATTLLASGVSILTPTFAPGGIAVSPTALASGLALFTPAISPGAVYVDTAALGSGLILRTPTLNPGAAPVAPDKLIVTPTLLTPTLSPGGISVSLTRLESGLVISTPVLMGAGSEIATTVLMSGAVLYTPTVVPGVVTVSPAAVGSSSVLATVVLQPGPIAVSPANIVSAVILYAPTGAVLSVIRPAAIASALVVFTPQFSLSIITPEPNYWEVETDATLAVVVVWPQGTWVEYKPLEGVTVGLRNCPAVPNSVKAWEI